MESLTTRTRLKIAALAVLFLMATTLVAITYRMETLATTCIAGLMTTGSSYLWAETKRPSKTNHERPLP